MGSLLRSEDMVLVRMVFDEVAGHDTVDELGKVGMFQFVDENEHESGFQRHFAPNVRRCEELQRCMRFLEKELASIDMEPLDDFTEISEDELRFEELEEHLGKLEKNLNSINGNMGQLKSQYTQLLEKKHVLEKGREFFKHAPATVQSSYGSMELNADMLSNIPKLSVKYVNENSQRIDRHPRRSRFSAARFALCCRLFSGVLTLLFWGGVVLCVCVRW